MKASIMVNISKIIGSIEAGLYSSFIEHMGRAIYTGIYEPEHACADNDGFRQDVIDLVKPLQLGYVRYPGGNFVSGYDWRDGIGPKKDRPVRIDLAWHAIEPNQVGIDEFLSWCEKVGVQPMIAVNLGTGTAKDAAELLEYCIAPKGRTTLAKLREQNGHAEPYSIPLICLGNEMDGPWQICAKTPTEYARVAHETAKMLKSIDPRVKLVLCGSSSREMPTFGFWEKAILRECWDFTDYLSLHAYYDNNDGDVPSFLSRSQDMDAHIEEVQAICNEIKLEKNSEKNIGLSFDEWNVWYHYRKEKRTEPEWICPRAIEEEDYNQDDALLVAAMLCSLINHCDIVKISCMAQLVNVIAPIRTIQGENAYTTSIYWPFLFASRFIRGKALALKIDSPTYPCRLRTNADSVSSCASLSEDGKHVSLLVVNKNLESTMQLEISGIDGYMLEFYEFYKNQQSDEPILRDNCTLSDILLKAGSWNLIRIILS